MPDTSTATPEVASSSSVPSIGPSEECARPDLGSSVAVGEPGAKVRRAGTQHAIHCTLSSLVGAVTANGRITIVPGDEEYFHRTERFPLSFETLQLLLQQTRHVGVTPGFRKVIDYFRAGKDEIPAGFRVELGMESEGVLRLDLVRDISYGGNGIKRPTSVLFSADSANPYEVEPIKAMIANLTCNPGIIYDLFINNPKANLGHRFNTRDEVMKELGNILGPGCDISVELNNPFAKSEQELLDEACHFRELLSEYRVVIKVPHTGPVNADNMGQLLTGNKKFSKRYDQVETTDAFRGHNLALLLHEHGFRVNFTLMFEPYQAMLALQAKPYFINSFIRHRAMQSKVMQRGLDLYDASGDAKFLEEIRTMLVEKDYLPPEGSTLDLLEVKRIAEHIVEYRKFRSPEGSDGLDAVRHNLRLLRNANLPDTRLIICSMEGENNFPDIDALLADREYEDVMDRVVVTAEPNYLAQFTTCNQVISYQRRFLNAAKGQV
jgi:hypothetical protein